MIAARIFGIWCLGFGGYCLSSFFAFAGPATLIASSPYKVRLSLRQGEDSHSCRVSTVTDAKQVNYVQIECLSAGLPKVTAQLEMNAVPQIVANDR